MQKIHFCRNTKTCVTLLNEKSHDKTQGCKIELWVKNEKDRHLEHEMNTENPIHHGRGSR
jgi:hypothetical protein